MTAVLNWQHNFVIGFIRDCVRLNMATGHLPSPLRPLEADLVYTLHICPRSLSCLFCAFLQLAPDQ